MRCAVRWLLLAALIAGAAGVRHPAMPLPPALEPASSGGLAAVDGALAKLSGHRRLLVVGAHPDDEDNFLLALVARGLGGEAAYLSLSRGEGGQNLIGPELGVGLGLLRTGELLAARHIEGTRQLFARAYDFGYTRSLEETFRRWPREALLEDAVRAVRRFKPQVIVAVFPGDERAGHGQHQASGVVAAEVYELAGEAERFPELGLPAWRPQALYRRAWRGEEGEVGLPGGLVEGLSGRSILQIAAASRSMHRSQDMGRIQPLGPYRAGLHRLAGGAGETGEGPFAGIDTRLAAIASALPESGARAQTAARLERVEGLARKARRKLSPVGLGGAVPDLAAIVSELGAARALLGRESEAAAALDLVEEKLAVAEAGLAAAAGIALEAVADREAVPPGEDVGATLSVWNSGARPLRVIRVELTSPEGWEVAEPLRVGRDLEPGELASWEFRAGVPEGAEPTLPYFLRRARVGDLYDWSDVAETVRGEPLQPPPLVARFELELAGVALALEREVVHRRGDQALGEVRRPLRAVPALELAPDRELFLWGLGHTSGGVQVELRSNRGSGLTGRLRVEVPEGWYGSEERLFEIEEPDGSGALPVGFAPPPGAEWGRYRVRLEAVLEGGAAARLAVPVVEYPHTRPMALPRPAEVEVSVFAMDVPKLRRVGYVEGPGDRVPAVLRYVGVPLRALAGRDLLQGELSRFDAIVVGSRAYETQPLLARANPRLLEYVREGGLLIVQYQQYPFVEGGFAPFPLEIARPHDRVTDESAPVRHLLPGHPVFHTPNEITARDWQWWVQERGLYFAHAWDPAYQPLLALADPGGDELRGSLLVARLGRGTYVYTGLAFFRQLPAGVPGALRLFANLLALRGA